VEFKVLGHVTVVYKENLLTLSKSKVGQTLSLLIARLNETVSVETLIDELWEMNAPRSVQTTLQTYVYHARRMLLRLGCDEAKERLVTRPSGYVLVADEDTLDADVFRHLAQKGTRHLDRGETDLGAERLSEALGLWRGPAFAGIPVGPILDAHVTYLNELRLNATSRWIEAHKRLGHHRELIPELRSLVSENPLNESFHALLIGTLHECGRRAEALQAYHRLCRILDTELGVRPGPEVQRMYDAVSA